MMTVRIRCGCGAEVEMSGNEYTTSYKKWVEELYAAHICATEEDEGEEPPDPPPAPPPGRSP